MRVIEKYADDYLTLPFEDRMVSIRRQKVLEQIVKYPHSRMMEIGCGMSPLFLYTDDYLSMHVIEPSLNFYNNALAAAISRRGVHCYHGFVEDYTAISREDDNIDFIIISSLLHEVENPDNFLNIIRQLCSPETVVHINVPNAYSVHRILAKEMGIIDNVFEFSQINKTMQQHSVYSMETLKEIIQRGGFRVIDEGSFFIKPFTHSQMEECIKQGIIDNKTLIGLSRLEAYMPRLGAEIFVNCRLE